MPQGGVSQPTDRSHASAPLNNNLDNYVDRDCEAVTATSIYIIFFSIYQDYLSVFTCSTF